MIPQAGGSYVADPKTGKLRLVERTLTQEPGGEAPIHPRKGRRRIEPPAEPPVPAEPPAETEAPAAAERPDPTEE